MVPFHFMTVEAALSSVYRVDVEFYGSYRACPLGFVH